MKVFVDSTLQNADWPKRTDDTRAALSLASETQSDLAKWWRSDKHPRGDNGRFIDKLTVESAATDHVKAAALMIRCTGENRKGLVDAFKAAGMQPETFDKAAKFVAWFGPSKVVKADGSPKESYELPTVVYHGTSQGGFREFDGGKMSNENELLYGAGFYFTEDREIANQYAMNGLTKRVMNQSQFDEFSAKLGETLPGGWKMVEHPRIDNFGLGRHLSLLHLSGAEVPIVAREDNNLPGRWMVDESGDEALLKHDLFEAADLVRSILPKREVKSVYLSIRKPFDLDRDRIGGFGYEEAVGAMGSKAKVREHLRSLGYDGFTHIGGTVTGGDKHRVWIAFEPTQIKATDNEGTYDPTNADMYKEFKQPKDGDGDGKVFDGTPQERLVIASDYDPTPYKRDSHQTTADGKTIEQLSLKEYIAAINPQEKHHQSDFMDSRSSENDDSISYMKRDRFPVLVATKNGIEYRRSGEKIRYVAHDADGEIARDEKGMALYMTDEQMDAAGLSKYDVIMAAFEGDKAIGFIGDSFGATELVVAKNQRGRGIGSELSYLFRKDNPFRDSGGFSHGGQAAAERSYWRMVYGKVPDEVVSIKRELLDIQSQIEKKYQETIVPIDEKREVAAKEHGRYSPEVQVLLDAKSKAFDDMREWELKTIAPHQESLIGELNKIEQMKPAELRAYLAKKDIRKEHKPPRDGDGDGKVFDGTPREQAVAAFSQLAIKQETLRIIKESPESEAEVYCDEESEDLLERMEWTPHDVASAIGAPDDAYVQVEWTGEGLQVRVEHPLIEGMNRLIKPAKGSIRKMRAGNIVIENEEFIVKGGEQGKGFGASVFTRQCANAARLGVVRIETIAARDDTKKLVGFAVWPRLGYSANLDGFEFNSKLTQRIREAGFAERDIMDLVANPKGREWWEKNGSSFQGTFDLDEGSRSWQTLSKYWLGKRVNSAT